MNYHSVDLTQAHMVGLQQAAEARRRSTLRRPRRTRRLPSVRLLARRVRRRELTPVSTTT